MSEAHKTAFDDLIVTEIPDDANQEIIKGKLAELIKKTREVAKAFVIERQKMSRIKRIIRPLEMHFKKVIDETNSSKPWKERGNSESRENRIKLLVEEKIKTEKLLPEVKDPYTELEILEDKVESYQVLMKSNHQISDQVIAMSNAQINIDKARKLING